MSEFAEEPLSEAAPRTVRPLVSPSWTLALSPWILILLYLSVAAHVRLGLGHWPQPMVEDYQSQAFKVHFGVVMYWGIFSLFAFPLWGVCLLALPLRPSSLRVVVWQLFTTFAGWAIFIGMTCLDPTSFSTWLMD